MHCSENFNISYNELVTSYIRKGKHDATSWSLKFVDLKSEVTLEKKKRHSMFASQKNIDFNFIIYRIFNSLILKVEHDWNANTQ